MRRRSLLVEQLETKIALDGASLSGGTPLVDAPPVDPPLVDVPIGPPTGIPAGPPAEVPVGRPDDVPRGNGQPGDVPKGPPTEVPVGRPDDVPRGNGPPGDVPMGPPAEVPAGRPDDVPRGNGPTHDVPRGGNGENEDPCETGGHSLGFWANRHGQEAIESNLAGALALLNDLNLRNADGSDAQFASALDVKSWLRSARARNMANMLSAQVAAMALNVHFGSVDGNALVEAAGTTSANALGQATIVALLGEANASLAASGLTTSGHPERSHQEQLKVILDDANNNQNFVNAVPCPDDAPAPQGPPEDVPRGKGPPDGMPGGKHVPRGNGPPDFVRDALFANPGFSHSMAQKARRGARM